MSIAQQRYRTARNLVVASTLFSASIVSATTLPYWAFVPILSVVCELFARLYDFRILGRRTKKPSPKSAFSNPDKVYTWQEVAAHNTEESAWIAINGCVYDITDFIDRHPGGREMILLSVGREATDLFNSYHPFTETPRKVLQKYRIGSLATFEHPTFKPDTGFYREASDAVKAYFDESGLDMKEPITGFIRMVPVYVLFFSLLFTINFIADIPMYVRLLMAVIIGCCQGMPLTGWMHDASHTSIGHSERWWWNVGRIALDYISGSSMLSWRNQHVLGHHVYTNVMGADPDLPVSLSADPRRLVDEQKWTWIYKFQHIYLPPLYGILGLKSRTQDFTEIYRLLMNGPIRVNPIAVEDYLRLISSKMFWATYRLVLPLVFAEALSLKQFLILFFTSEFTTGYWLAFNFQVSHVSDEAEFLFSDTKKREIGKCPAAFDMEWAKCQIVTTIDYGHGSPVAAYLSGALNYQTIHHLFPTVSQYHYPAITPIVMKIAEKHGMKFTVFDNFWNALNAHIGHLKQMGVEGKSAELKLE